MSGPTYHFSAPPAHFFNFPPSPEPRALAPPAGDGTLRNPWSIDEGLYNAVLSPALPLTFACVYIITISVLNQVNRRSGFTPWAISKTRLFKIFVILHNVFLAVYSGITCYAMIHAVAATLPSVFDESGIPGKFDALCKMNGPRGLGDAVTYNSTTNLWSSRSPFIHLSEDGILPDSTDVGRLWNEGLAFWGWYFYLSKFYEVVDTAIIILKGKRSSTLQTYHHAGAMLCMWAGMRYMSAPIWMFVLVNSGIHTIMYTYYTLTGLGIKISNKIKSVITTMQITQFLVGAVFATMHLFVSYSVPVMMPYTVLSAVETIASEISAAASAITEDPAAAFASVTSSVAAAVATATIDLDKHAWFKKLAFRAAGFEGLAEAVRDKHGETFGLEHDTRPLRDALRRIEKPKFIEEIKYRTEYQEVRCLDTEGQAFAIWLNVFYLTPLTVLFLRFFLKTYIWGTTSKTGKGRRKSRTASDSVFIAAKKTRRAFEHVGTEVEEVLDEAVEDFDSAFGGIREKATEVEEEIEDATKDWSVENAIERLRREFAHVAHNPEFEEVLEKFQGMVQKTSQTLHVQEIVKAFEEKASQLVSDVSEQAGVVKHETGASYSSIKEDFSRESFMEVKKEEMEDSVVRVTREVDDALTGAMGSVQQTGASATSRFQAKEKELEAKLHEYESGGESSSRADLSVSPTKQSMSSSMSSSSSSSKIPTATPAGKSKHRKHHSGHHHGHSPVPASPTVGSLSYADVADPTVPTAKLHKP